jgi:hypothetical protein
VDTSWSFLPNQTHPSLPNRINPPEPGLSRHLITDQIRLDKFHLFLFPVCFPVESSHVVKCGPIWADATSTWWYWKNLQACFCEDIKHRALYPRLLHPTLVLYHSPCLLFPAIVGFQSPLHQSFFPKGTPGVREVTPGIRQGNWYRYPTAICHRQGW